MASTSTPLSSICNLTSKILSNSSMGGCIKEEIDKLSKMVSRIRASLADAEDREIKDELLKLCSQQLKTVAYDAEDILSDFNYNLLSAELDEELHADKRKRKFEVVYSILSHPYNGALFLSRIKKVTEQFNEIWHDFDALWLREEDGRRKFNSIARPPSSSFADPSVIFGRENDQKMVINSLINIYEPKLDVIALVAMCGMGKTTVAKLAFNSSIVQEHFDLRGWVWVSEFSDEITITRLIIESLTNRECGLCQLDALQSRLAEILNRKKFLLVLDDICIEDTFFWETIKSPLRDGMKGSRILITSENHNVAKCVGAKFTISLNGLSKSDSLALFSYHAFNNRDPDNIPSNLVEIGERIVDKCNGVPLVLKTLGGLLTSSSDEEEWDYVLQSEIWELEEHRKNMEILNLSYHRLPPHLQPCFMSCAVFPKGHEFETDTLVRIWAARGLIQGEDTNHMEVGRTYVNDLLQRSFFENKVTRGAKPKFTMHDLMHDLSRWIVGGESAIVEGEELGKRGGSKDFRHLTVVVKKDTHISFDSFHGCSPLRSLFIHSYNQTRFYLDSHFFNHEFLQYLHVLDLNFLRSRELPETIGNLKHLRFLGLSGQSLPESICRLLNLQTLDLRTRGNHITLPTSIGRLQSLRHLIVSPWDVSKMPIGIGYLINLETLSVFAVSRENGSATLNELKNMNNLRDELNITGLHHILHDDMVYSMDPDLARKKKLTRLFLRWSTFVKSKAKNNDENLLQILRPHTNIQHIAVEGYRGTRFPSWFGDNRFTRLACLKLDNCMNCTKLPAVGQLPMLRHLKLERLKALKTVGQEFYGNSNVSFPSLETLSVYEIPELEKWCYRDGEGSLFPSLRELHVSFCEKLRSFQISNLPPLQTCSFNWCGKLAEIDGLIPGWIARKTWCGVVDTRSFKLQQDFLCNEVSKLEFLYRDPPYHVLRKMTIVACPLLQGLGNKKAAESTTSEGRQNLVQPKNPEEIASTSAHSEENNQTLPYIAQSGENIQTVPYIAPSEENNQTAPYIAPSEENNQTAPYIDQSEENNQTAPYISPSEQTAPYIAPSEQTAPYIAQSEENNQTAPSEENNQTVPYIAPSEENNQTIPYTAQSEEPKPVSRSVRPEDRKRAIWHDENDRLRSRNLLGMQCALLEEMRHDNLNMTGNLLECNKVSKLGSFNRDNPYLVARKIPNITRQHKFKFTASPILDNEDEMRNYSQHKTTLLFQERREEMDSSSTSTFLHMWANSIRNTFLSGFSFFKSMPASRTPPVKEVRRTSL